MAETYIFQKAARHNEKREKMLNLVLWIIIIFLLSIALVKIIFQFFIFPGFKITDIILESDVTITKEEIFRIAGIEKNKYYSDKDLKNFKKSLETMAGIKDVNVEKVFPDKLRIQLTAHVPVAIGLADVNERNIPVAFDENGAVVIAGRGIGNLNLPVISGLKFNSIEEGIKLPKQLLSFLKEITLLKQESEHLYDLISEIRVEPVGTLDYELLLYLIPYKTPVRIGRKLSGEQLGYAVMVLDILAESKADNHIKEIDFRTNEAVYKEAVEGVLN